MSRAEMGSKELDQNVELVDTAIRRLLEERKSRGATGDVRDDEDHLLLSRLLSQLDSLKGNVNEIHEAEAVAETAAISEGGGAELVAAKAENGEEFDKEEIVKELNKLKRQNTITHWLLSVMIVLIVAWQASEVTLLWKVRNGLSNPFRSVGGLFSKLFQGRVSDQNGHHEKHKTLKTDAFEFKMPEIKSTEIVGISSEEH